MSAKEQIEKLLSKAGIKVNGKKSYDIQVHDERLYKRIIRDGSLGFGEAYMDGWWDIENLDELIARILRAKLEEHVKFNVPMIAGQIRGRIVNMAKRHSLQIGREHYDIGNDLYKKMLDERLTYTCGYFKNVKTLKDAQEAKLDLICRKLSIKKGDRVLDIGSGWGSFINYAAEKYEAECVGVTVSKEQAQYANSHKKGLPVETRFQDYRDIDEKFDHIVSIGMFEHVGQKNYRTFMKKVHFLLKDEGLFLLHTIGSKKSVATTDPWVAKYIFPNSMLPSIKQIAKASEKLFVMEDWHSFGQYYDTTLMHWFKNFDSAWPELKEKYNERFYRMWKYYLLSSAGSFRARKNQLWQIVFSKNGLTGGYKSIR